MSKTTGTYLDRHAKGINQMTRKRWKKLRGQERHGGLAPRPKPTPKAKKRCPQCAGKGFKMLAHGPMVMDGQGVPAGVSRYDCRACDGTGRAK